MLSGLKQTVMFGEIGFSVKKMKNYDLFKETGTYYPLVVSINYNSEGQNYAFICYCVFTKDGNNKITGTRTIKQLVLIAGMPFEIKSIYGLKNENELDDQVKDVKGVKAAGDENEDKECTICMSEQSNAIIMPCGHMCVCMDCGKSLQSMGSGKNLCPVCRGAITTLIPMKR